VTIFAETPCHETLQEKQRPFATLEIQRTFPGSIKTLVELLATNFTPEESVIEREISRLGSIFSSTGLESDVYVALALYNTRQTNDLRAPASDLSELRDHIQRKTMEQFVPSDLVFYLVIEVVIIDLLVPHQKLPPPAGPRWTYEPLQIIDAQTLSTQLTKVLTFVDCFDLDRQARDILPRLRSLESIQARDKRTPQVITKWKEMWTEVQTLYCESVLTVYSDQNKSPPALHPPSMTFNKDPSEGNLSNENKAQANEKGKERKEDKYI